MSIDDAREFLRRIGVDESVIADAYRETKEKVYGPLARGCICDVCADRGVECTRKAFSEYDDLCATCLRH